MTSLPAAALLRRVPLLSHLNESELHDFAGAIVHRRVKAGELLFAHGDVGDALYVVATGLLEALVDAGLPSERLLTSFGPGDFFGEMALLTGERRSATVRARDDSQVLGLSKIAFDRLVTENPQIAVGLSRVLSSRLSATNEQLSRHGGGLSVLVPVGDRDMASHLVGPIVTSMRRQQARPVLALWIDSPFAPSDGTRVGSPEMLAVHDGETSLQIGRDVLENISAEALWRFLSDCRRRFSHVAIITSPDVLRDRNDTIGRASELMILACGESGLSAARALSNPAGSSPTFRYAYTGAIGHARPELPSGRAPAMRVFVKDGKGDIGSIDSVARALLGATIGVALSGGAAQGTAHVGVLEALVRAGIPIDLIAGTSGGALYGSLLASGLSIEEVKARVIHNTRHNLRDRSDYVIPRRGLIRGASIERMVHESTNGATFDDLRFPLYAVAADLMTGEEVVVEDGPVSHGVRASISVPGVFEPFVIGGRTLVDGGVVNPLPVSVCRARGANFVIACSVPAPGKLKQGSARADQRYNIVSVVVRSYYFAGDVIANANAADADVLIKPAVEHFGWRDYRSSPHIIEAGRLAGEQAIERIRSRLPIAFAP